MRILIHDFPGYPFPIQLSRQLAARGHDVCHVYCGSVTTTPGGSLFPLPSDSPSLSIKCIRLSSPLEKYSFLKRWTQENEFGKLACHQVDQFQPDIVVSANAPLDTQRRLQIKCHSKKIPFVFWVQDLIGVATHRMLSGRFYGFGALVGRYYLQLESRLLRQSELVLMITEDFRPMLRQFGVCDEKMRTIENWAPISELPVVDNVNAWSREHGLENYRCVIYSGTMGMKHNPRILLELARRVRDRSDVCIVVVSNGLGAKWLKENALKAHLPNLRVLDFQPFDRIPEVFGTAEVLAAVLEPDASVFSVPSKVLAYMCSGRPLVIAISPENLAARLVNNNGAGIVVAPDDIDGFVEATVRLLDDADERKRMGDAGRRYAERTFDVTCIASQFENEFKKLVQPLPVWSSKTNEIVSSDLHQTVHA